MLRSSIALASSIALSLVCQHALAQEAAASASLATPPPAAPPSVEAQAAGTTPGTSGPYARAAAEISFLAINPGAGLEASVGYRLPLATESPYPGVPTLVGLGLEVSGHR